MSNNTSQLAAWLTNLGTQYGRTFQLDSQGQCLISVNNNRVIHLHNLIDSNHFCINIEIMDAPQHSAIDTYKLALKMNLFQAKTRGATIAIDDKTQRLMLCFMGCYERMEFNDFYNILNNLINVSEEITQLFKNEKSTTRISQISTPVETGIRV